MLVSQLFNLPKLCWIELTSIKKYVIILTTIRNCRASQSIRYDLIKQVQNLTLVKWKLPLKTSQTCVFSLPRQALKRWEEQIDLSAVPQALGKDDRSPRDFTAGVVHHSCTDR